MRRRDWIAGAAATTGFVMATSKPSKCDALDPITRSGPPRMKLGLAAYSFRKYFRHFRDRVQEVPENQLMTMPRFMEYCVEHGLAGAELTSYFFPPDANQKYFRNLQRQAHLSGLAISGTAIGNNFTTADQKRLTQEIASTKEWIEKAAMMGAPHIRIFAGSGKELSKAPERLGQIIDAVGECAEHAARYGVMLGVENHGAMSRTQMLQILGAIESDWVGMNWDSGNFFSDDPYGDLEATAGYAINVQIKPVMKDSEKRTTPADFARVIGILKSSRYQGFVHLEDEGDDPLVEVPMHLAELKKVIG